LKLNGFQKVKSIEEAFALAEQEGNIVLGGGAWLRLGNSKKNIAIDLDLLDLNTITVKDDMCHIGAMTTLYQIETSVELQRLYSGIISESASKIMGVQVRNIATIGGTVCGKYGFSDLITPLLASGAILNFHKEGKITLEEFLLRKGKRKDILIEVIIPMKKGLGAIEIFKKTSIDFSVINVAVVNVTESEELLLAIGSRPGVAKLTRLTKQEILEEAIIDGEFNIHRLHEYVNTLIESYSFGSNQRASMEYREQLAKVFVQKCIKEVLI